jgi:hypothetical protein
MLRRAQIKDMDIIINGYDNKDALRSPYNDIFLFCLERKTQAHFNQYGITTKWRYLQYSSG